MITNETAKSTYVIADGVNTYAIGFQYDYNPDGTPQIQLYLNNHPELPLVYGTDYTLSGDELSVVLLDNYSVGDKLHILRSIPMVQLSDYVIGRIDPEQIERDFDESVMRDQQLKAEIDTLSELPIDHERRIVAIEEVIPDEATPSNKLTDKNYVDTQISNHTSRTDNPHTVTAAQVGLGNCDNTSDANKPISTATQNALDLKANVADLGTAAATDATDYATAAQGGKADTAVQPGDLATVATSGLYSDLSGKPTIPTTLAALTGDVNIATPSGGDYLIYDSDTSKWVNTPSAATVSWGGILGTLGDQTDLQNALDGKVSKTGDETIGGNKTFSLAIQAPSIYQLINDKIAAMIQANTQYSTDHMVVLQASDDTGDYHTDAVLHWNNGSPYFSAPASDVNTSVVTTEGKHKAQNGYIKLGNGIIIQWGITPTISAQDQFVSLPTAFTSSNYSVTACMNFSGGSNHCCCHSLSTTGFKMRVGAGGYQYNFIAIGY